MSFLDRFKPLYTWHTQQPELQRDNRLHPAIASVWQNLKDSHAEVVAATGTDNADEIQVILGIKKEES